MSNKAWRQWISSVGFVWGFLYVTSLAQAQPSAALVVTSTDEDEVKARDLGAEPDSAAIEALAVEEHSAVGGTGIRNASPRLVPAPPPVFDPKMSDGSRATGAAPPPSGGTYFSDWDGDYVDDELELALAKKYFPHTNMHCSTYLGVPNGSKGQFYGTSIGYATNGKLPFTAHIYYDTRMSPCNISGGCIEVRYAMPYNWDLGDQTYGGSHPGDTEMISMLLTTASSWSTASTDPNVWYVWKIYRSAHACTTGDSSYFQNWLSYDRPYNWVAEGKNANYSSQASCNNGGVLGIDNCSVNRCYIYNSYAQSKLRNAGEFGDPNAFGQYFSGFIPRNWYTNGYDGFRETT